MQLRTHDNDCSFVSRSLNFEGQSDQAIDCSVARESGRERDGKDRKVAIEEEGGRSREETARRHM